MMDEEDDKNIGDQSPAPEELLAENIFTDYQSNPNSYINDMAKRFVAVEDRLELSPQAPQEAVILSDADTKIREDKDFVAMCDNLKNIMDKQIDKYGPYKKWDVSQSLPLIKQVKKMWNFAGERLHTRAQTKLKAQAKKIVNNIQDKVRQVRGNQKDLTPGGSSNSKGISFE